jgi:hypothetical protein
VGAASASTAHAADPTDLVLTAIPLSPESTRRG